VTRLARALSGALALLAVAALPARFDAQSNTLPPGAVHVPWQVGERFDYDVKFGFVRAGSGQMTVVGIEPVRGRQAWRGRFTVHGGVFGLKVDDMLETWMDVTTLTSLRFTQDFSEIGRDREKLFDIFPERGTFIQHGKPEQVTVPEPLDDGSFLYFIRTQLLEVGKEYSYDRYFDPEANPVRIKVLRKERIRVPAGEFDAIVLQPIIKTSGIFSEGGEATIWLSDDSRRMVLQLKSKLNFGSLNLYLLRYRLAEGGTWMGEDP